MARVQSFPYAIYSACTFLSRFALSTSSSFSSFSTSSSASDSISHGTKQALHGSFMAKLLIFQQHARLYAFFVHIHLPIYAVHLVIYAFGTKSTSLIYHTEQLNANNVLYTTSVNALCTVQIKFIWRGLTLRWCCCGELVVVIVVVFGCL